MSRLKHYFAVIREDWFGSWLNLRKLSADAKAIKFDPGAALAGELSLHNRPFAFALQALVLPHTLLLAAVSVFGLIFPIPSPIDTDVTKARDELASLSRMAEISGHKARVAVTSVPARLRGLSPADLQRLLQAANEERVRLGRLQSSPDVQLRQQATAVELRLLQRALHMQQLLFEYVKVVFYIRDLRQRIVIGTTISWFQRLAVTCAVPATSVGLLFNAVVFSWLIDRSNSPFDNTFNAASGYLYVVGAVSLLPNLLTGFLIIQLDLVYRYYPRAPASIIAYGAILWLLVAVSFYAIVQLLRMIRPLSLALRPRANISRRAAYWHVVLRLIGAHLLTSSLLSGLAIGLVIVGYAFINLWERVSPW